MKTILHKKPQEITDEEFAEIINLHRAQFNLSSESIKHYLLERDYIDLYLSPQGEIIGTVGTKWYEINGNIILYIGNAVVKNNFQQTGILTSTIYSMVCKTFLRFPHKKKYAIAFSTTPEAYGYFSKFKYFWPKPKTSFSPEVKKISEFFLNTHYKDNYVFNNDCFFIKGLQNNVIKTSQSTYENQYKNWFVNINPDYINGTQLLCCVPFNMGNFMTVITTVKKSVLKNIQKTSKTIFDRYKKKFTPFIAPIMALLGSVVLVMDWVEFTS